MENTFDTPTRLLRDVSSTITFTGRFIVDATVELATRVTGVVNSVVTKSAFHTQRCCGTGRVSCRDNGGALGTPTLSKEHGHDDDNTSARGTLREDRDDTGNDDELLRRQVDGLLIHGRCVDIERFVETQYGFADPAAGHDRCIVNDWAAFLCTSGRAHVPRQDIYAPYVMTWLKNELAVYDDDYVSLLNKRKFLLLTMTLLHDSGTADITTVMSRDHGGGGALWAQFREHIQRVVLYSTPSQVNTYLLTAHQGLDIPNLNGSNWRGLKNMDICRVWYNTITHARHRVART